MRETVYTQSHTAFDVSYCFLPHYPPPAQFLGLSVLFPILSLNLTFLCMLSLSPTPKSSVTLYPTQNSPFWFE